jgi:hypothetical protein
LRDEEFSRPVVAPLHATQLIGGQMADEHSSRAETLKAVAESYYSFLRATRLYRDACDTWDGSVGETQEQQASIHNDFETSIEHHKSMLYALERTLRVPETLAPRIPENMTP